MMGVTEFSWLDCSETVQNEHVLPRVIHCSELHLGVKHIYLISY